MWDKTNIKKGEDMKTKAKSVKLVIVLLATASVLASLAVPTSASVVPATQIKTSYGQKFIINYDNISIHLGWNHVTRDTWTDRAVLQCDWQLFRCSNPGWDKRK
jgi:hypothetical protein